MGGLESLGRLLLALGIAIIVVGLALMLAGRFHVLGRLPGDISFHVGQVTVHLPLATSLLLSVVLTILLNLIFRLFRH